MRFLIAVLDSGTTTAMPGEMQAIDAPDVATAHALAMEGSKCCNRTVEVR